MGFLIILASHPLQETEPVGNVIQITTAVLLLFILAACVGSLILLFKYAGSVHTFELQQSIINDALKDWQKGRLYTTAELIQEKIANIQDEIEQKKANLESAEGDEKEKIEKQLQIERANLEQAEQEYKKRLEEIEKEADDFASSVIPNRVSLSQQFGPYFYIEFGTVIIIFTLLALALLGTLRGQEVASILAAISGYVLGKATRPSTNGKGKE